MEITFFGLIWILLLFIFLLRKNIIEITMILFISMVLQCNNVVTIGGKGIGPQIITSLFFIFSFFIVPCHRVVKKSRISKPFVVMLSFFCIYVLLNVFYLNSLTEQFQDILMLFVYVLTCICLYNIRYSFPDDKIWEMVCFLYKFLLIVGFLQLLVTSRILPKWLLTELFFNDTSDNIYFHAAYPYYRVMSTFMEPSYFSGIFSGLLIGIIFNKRKIKNAGIYIFCGLLEIVLTISTTAYLTLICGFLILILIDNSNNKFLKYLPYLLVLIFFVYFAWDTLLSEVVFNKLESNSGVERQSWNLKAYEEFMSNPSFGCGYINVRASSLLLTILANLGLVGMCFYLSAVCMGLYPVLSKNKNRIAVLTRLIMICVIISQFVACPDLTLCTFWLSVYFVVLTG